MPSVATVIFEVIRHTPTWVWGLLAALVLLGLSQWRDQTLARPRVLLMPVALAGYSAYGAASLFGATPPVLLAWVAGLAALLVVARRLPWLRGVRHDPLTERFAVPGSVWPLLLMLGVFSVRYMVTVTLVFHRDWVADPAFAAAMSALYGSLSGLFAARALKILSARRVQAAAPDITPPPRQMSPL